MTNNDTSPKVIVRLPDPYVDDRGTIQPLVDVNINDVAYVRTKKGAIRANHYHKTDWHYCYVLSGEIEYFCRPVGSDAEPERVVVRPGEMFFTPPQVEHAMRFTEDTVFIVMSRNDRSHGAYEGDVVRINLI